MLPSGVLMRLNFPEGSNFMCSMDLFESGANLASTVPLPGQKKPKPKSKSQRIRLHEMDHWCCSIIGTCLKHEDLIAFARKRDITMDPDVKNVRRAWVFRRRGRQGR